MSEAEQERDATCEACAALLSDALNLVVRARTLDGIDRRASFLAWSSDADGWQESGQFERFVDRYNAEPDNWYKQIEPRCLTGQLWVTDQYEKDLADWEIRARQHLLSGYHHNPKETPNV